jgi:RES domain
MPVNPGLSTTIASGQLFYRITSVAYSVGPRAKHRRVVNGEGAIKNRKGARYNYPGARTVYLAQDLETCFAERMFYVHRQILRALDRPPDSTTPPPFQLLFTLWTVSFNHPITDVADLTKLGALNYFFIFPSLTLNPSQDYLHLKDRRAEIESQGYSGLIVGSSRAVKRGNLVVLFEDQSFNVQNIIPHEVEFRLIDENGDPFHNHATQLLDFTAGEVRFTGAVPPDGAAYRDWQRVDFNH